MRLAPALLFGPRFTAACWALWLALCAWLIAEPFRWHVEYFKSPGPQFYVLILVAIPVWIGAAILYSRVRRRGLWRWEPAAFFAFALIVALVYRPTATIAVALITMAIYGLGRRALASMGIESGGPLESLVISAGTGLGLWTIALFALGLAHGYRVEIIAPLIALNLIWARHEIKHSVGHLRALHDSWRSDPSLSAPLPGLVVFFLALFLACGLAVTLAPALAHDALMMHLPMVRHYAEQHALVPLPFLDYSYFPQGAEMIWTVAFILGGLPAAQLMAPVATLLTLAVVWLIAGRFGLDRPAKLLGLAFGATLPFFHQTGSVVKNDPLLFAYQGLALLLLLQSRNGDQRRSLRLGVFFLALSFGVKHVAVLGAVPIGCLYLWEIRGARRRLRELALWVAIFAASTLFWHIRTFALTGNPVYPRQLWESVEPLRPQAMRPPEWGRIPWYLVPWTVHFVGHNAFESPTENPTGFFLLLFLPCWLLLRRNRHSFERRAVWIFLAVYFSYLALIWPVIRYAILPVLVLVALTAGRLRAMVELSGPAIRFSLAAAAVANLTFCLLVTMLLEINGPQLLWFAKRIDDEEYLRRTLISYRSLEYLRQNAVAGDYILSVANNSAAYAPSPETFNCERLVDPVAARPQIPTMLEQRDYAYLITPRSTAGEAIADDVAKLRPTQLEYEDAHYQIHSLKN